MRFAVMAGVAIDLGPAVELSLIQIKDHLHHLAGHVFVLKTLFLIVAVIRSMTKLTIYTERSRNHVHDLSHLVGRHVIQDLDALKFLAGCFNFSLCISHRNNKRQCRRKKSCNY